jgi:methionine--tRNA ligase beta chain
MLLGPFGPNNLSTIFDLLTILQETFSMTIKFEDFAKLDIKIGTVQSVERVSDVDKLLKFTFDIGNETRQIMASMAPFFTNLNELLGRQMPLLLNIEPRTFRGYESQGMIIAADHENRPVFLLPEVSVPSGTKVK